MTSSLERAVEVMDRLRSPGGCRWDAAQTHESLTRYLVEECYEVIEAIETGDAGLLREELGDLLLQVLFHARITQELPAEEAFGIDEVADDLVRKLIRRHPHVFEAADPGQSATELNEKWERQKALEKGRTSAVDGVPLHQPALALAAKLVARATRADLDVTTPTEDEIGLRLFEIVREAVAADLDPEAALRRTARQFRAAMMDKETAIGTVDPARHHGE